MNNFLNRLGSELPPLTAHSSKGSRRDKRFSKRDLLQSRIWSFLAKKSCLGPFYDTKRTHNSYMNSMIDSGFVIIENFLDSKTFERTYSSPSFEITDNKTKPYYEIYKQIRPSTVVDIIDNSILPEILNSLNFKNIYPRTQFNYIRSDQKPPWVEGLSDWHCDRYIPCLKGLYFPEGCNWMPFERVVMPTSAALALPLSLTKTHHEFLPDRLTKYTTYSTFTKPNTFILCQNSIFHRRASAIEQTGGSRKIVFMDWNHQFNRKDILKSAAQNVIKSISGF